MSWYSRYVDCQDCRHRFVVISAQHIELPTTVRTDIIAVCCRGKNTPNYESVPFGYIRSRHTTTDLPVPLLALHDLTTKRLINILSPLSDDFRPSSSLLYITLVSTIDYTSRTTCVMLIGTILIKYPGQMCSR